MDSNSSRSLSLYSVSCDKLYEINAISIRNVSDIKHTVSF